MTQRVPFVSLFSDPAARSVPPHTTQQGNGVLNDCGWACEAMKALWLGKSLSGSLAFWRTQVDAAQDGSTWRDLEALLRWFGLTPHTARNVPYPYTTLVRYSSLPHKAPGYEQSTFLHWVERISATAYNDPLFTSSKGAGLEFASESAFNAIELDPLHRVGVVERPANEGGDMAGEPRVQYGRVVNVLPADATIERSIEVLRQVHAAKQTVGYSYDDAGVGNLTDRTAVLWDIPQANRSAFTSFYQQYYPGVKVAFKPDGVPPQPEPQPPASHPAFESITRAQALTGMHTINWVEDARTAADMGCRVITMLDNLSGAREMRNRGCVVIHRTWFNDPGWTPANCFDRLGVNADDRLIVVGQNECDAGRCPGDVNKLRERFNWDKEFAEIVWQRAPKCFPAIGGFSVGTPMIDAGGEYARVFRETYGAFCNANAHRVGINWHLYVWRRVTGEWKPSTEPIYGDQRWWAGRAKFFAYDPIMGGLNNNVISVSDEIGGECGQGGWNWAGYNDADATRWWDYWRGLYEGFPQLKYATVFIGCRSESWRGYDVRHLWPGAFRPIWASANRDAMSFHEGAELAERALYESAVYVGGDEDEVGRQMYAARGLQRYDE